MADYITLTIVRLIKANWEYTLFYIKWTACSSDCKIYLKAALIGCNYTRHWKIFKSVRLSFLVPVYGGGEPPD